MEIITLAAFFFMLSLFTGCSKEKEIIGDTTHIINEGLEMAVTGTDENTISDYVDLVADIAEEAEDIYEEEKA